MATGYWDVDGTWKEGDSTYTPPPTTTTTPPPPPGSTGAGYWDVDGTWKEPSDTYVPGPAVGYMLPDGTMVGLGGSGSIISPTQMSYLSSAGASPRDVRSLPSFTQGYSFSGSYSPTEQGDGIRRGVTEGTSSGAPNSFVSPTVTPTLDTIDFLSSAFEVPKTFSTPPSTGILGVANNRSRR